MTNLKRRVTYQYGMLVPEPRRRGPDVWVYRFFENRKGKRVRRKSIVGTVDEMPQRAEAERACEKLRLAADNSPQGRMISRHITDAPQVSIL